MDSATTTAYLVDASGSTTTLLTLDSFNTAVDLHYAVILLLVVCALLSIDLVRRLFTRR